MNIDPLLIMRFFRNECTAEENAQVARHLKDHPEELERYLGEAEWMDVDPAAQLPPARSMRMKQAVMDTIGKQRAFKWIPYRLLAAAAVLGILLTIGYLWQQDRMRSGNNAAAPADRMITVHSGMDTAKQVRLPDGSLLVLGSYSQVRYHAAFAANRTIMLEGDALFDVARDPVHPFYVKTGPLHITVLGTRFQVRGGQQQEKIRIQLFSGKIKVGLPRTASAPKKSIELLPGKELLYNNGKQRWDVRPIANNRKPVTRTHKATGAINRTDVNPDDLFFESQRLNVVLNTLQQHFDIPVHYTEKHIRNYYFSGSFTANDPLAEILSTIATLNGLQVKQDSTGYTLQAPGK